MPIYAYRCSACGHQKDVLRKLSDAALTTCPACGTDHFSKQVTAAGFQLKGSGWYATDFKGGAKPAPAASDAAPADSGGGKGSASGGGSTDGGSSGGGSADGGSTPTAAASSGSCGSSCACH